MFLHGQGKYLDKFIFDFSERLSGAKKTAMTAF